MFPVPAQTICGVSCRLPDAPRAPHEGDALEPTVCVFGQARRVVAYLRVVLTYLCGCSVKTVSARAGALQRKTRSNSAKKTGPGWTGWRHPHPKLKRILLFPSRVVFVRDPAGRFASGRGGIGRRAALRSLWDNTRGGSSPPDRTIKNKGSRLSRVTLCFLEVTKGSFLI